MARLTRKNIKVFAGNATNNGVFGSLQAENPVTTTNVEQIQSLPAWNVGWDSATMTSEKLPPLEEFQGIQYVTTYQQAYLMQEGLPEWAASVTYYKGSLVKQVTSTGFRIYNSLADNNTGNLLSDSSKWKKVMDSDDLYAFNNEVVHKTGDENINGTKTFIKGKAGIRISRGSEAYTEVMTTKGDVNYTRTGGFRNIEDNGINESTMYVATADGVDISEKISVCRNTTTGDVYTYAPTPTDTTSTSSYQIATVGWVNSTNNNVVHKTGDETIGGTKTFTSDPYIKNIAPKLYMDDTQQTKGTAPSADVWNSIDFRDTDGNMMGRCRQIYTTSKINRVELQVYKANSSGDTDYAYLGIRYPASGDPYTYAPASDVINSIVTTTAIHKATSKGSFKLGNGMIVNYGSQEMTKDSTTVCTFDTPFSGNYTYGLSTSYKSGVTRDDPLTIQDRTSTNFTVRNTARDSGSVHCIWVAIGY